MSLNRRNYYRLLFVQPDAPLPVIKAAYHALVADQQRVSGSASVVLSEAYTVLADPVLRAAYDAKTLVRTQHTPLEELLPVDAPPAPPAKAAPPQPAARGAAPSATAAAPAVPPAPATPFPGTPFPGTPFPGTPFPGTPFPSAPFPGTPFPGTPAKAAAPTGAPRSAPPTAPAAPAAPTGPAVACPMCQTTRTGRISADSRCERCQAPLAPVARASRGRSGAGNERRALPRVGRSDWATLVAPWNAEAVRVRLRDLSADGISVYTATRLAAGTRVRIANERFDVVATVVACRSVRHVFSVHARVETVWVAPKGTAAGSAGNGATAGSKAGAAAGASRGGVRQAPPASGRRVS